MFCFILFYFVGLVTLGVVHKTKPLLPVIERKDYSWWVCLKSSVPKFCGKVKDIVVCTS